MKLIDQSKTLARLAILLMVASLAACGGSSNNNDNADNDDNDEDPEPVVALEVTSTSPEHDATDVDTNRNITATFNRSINADTLDTFSFTVEGMDEAPINGAVTFDADNETATFTPESNLGAETVYEATITTDVEDAEGNTLENDFVWQFTTSSASDETAPTVTGTDPSDGATDVPFNRNVTATLSEDLDSTTLTGESFVVADADGNAVAGNVSIDGKTTAVFNPESDFESETVYTATLKTDVTDLANPANPLEADYVWSFTTGASADETAPSVTGTDPSDGATDVPFNRNVAATFSEKLDATTLTSESFVVADADGNAIAGDVSVVGTTTAVFNPENDFESDTVYTATLNTDVTDQANPANALEADHVWSFTTGASAAEGPAPVVLGSAGDYVVLAKSEITTTGTTEIVGDLGISPAARSYMTGFDEILDASTEFATSALVTGSLYAASMTEPTPSNLTTAISNMETAYIDAAGRSNPDHTELGAGDISGMTLEPGLYNWGTNLLIASDITLSGSANDVWILQIAQDLSVSNGVIITLDGGALPENIFWQVAGQATLGTTADMKGVILSKTKIVLNTGAVLNGRALAQTAVNLDANAVTQPDQ